MDRKAENVEACFGDEERLRVTDRIVRVTEWRERARDRRVRVRDRRARVRAACFGEQKTN